MSNWTWTDKDRETLRALYLTHSRAEIATILGRTKASVRQQCSHLGLNTKRPGWTDDEVARLREWYATHEGDQSLGLEAFAVELGRVDSNVARKARQLGLTDAHRLKTDAQRAAISERVRRQIAENGHPKGMLGKHHTPEVVNQMKARMKAWIESETAEDRERRIDKRLQTNIERYGTAGPAFMLAENPYSRAMRGRREDLHDIFFRSSWEANYARYLRFLQAKGEIEEWAYEPETFIFHGVKRNPISYTPDFRVREKGGRVRYHEVKGWMDSKSKSKLARMATFYPDVEIIVIGQDEYESIAKWGLAIDRNWEVPRSKQKQNRR